MKEGTTFAERLAFLREEMGLRRQDVADAIGISRASLEYYEKGKRKPDVDILIRLASFYGVSTDYLVGMSYFRMSANENEKLKIVCDFTGLSEESIKYLLIACDNESRNDLNEIMQTGIYQYLSSMVRQYRMNIHTEMDCLKLLLDQENTKPIDAFMRFDAKNEEEFTLFKIQKEVIDRIRYVCREDIEKCEELRKQVFEKDHDLVKEYPIRKVHTDYAKSNFV